METKFYFAKTITKEAGAFLREQMTDKLVINQKTNHTDLVTNLDREVQAFLISRIKQAYPSDLIFAEENEVNPSIQNGHVWVIDPIDGTVNFVAQEDDFAIMLAYFEDGIGQFGLIYDVMADKLYSGGPAFYPFCNQKPLPLYEQKPLQSQIMISNSNMYRSNQAGLADLIDDSLGCRTYGSAGISMARILEGKATAYFSKVYPWDYAAAKIIGASLGYSLLTLSGAEPDLQTRQAVMFIPQVEQSLYQKYLKA